MPEADRTVGTAAGSSDGEIAVHARRASEGDQASLSWLMEAFDRFLVVQARYRLSGRLAHFCPPEDLIHETWIVALSKLPTLRFDSGPPAAVFRKYLATTLRNIVSNVIRRYIRRGVEGPAAATPSSSGASGMDHFQAFVTGASTMVRRSEVHDLVTNAIDNLSEPMREIVILRGIEELELSEVAAILHITPNTAAVRFHRAIRELRRQLPASCCEWLPDDD